MNLSPSLAHIEARKQIRPRLAYNGQPSGQSLEAWRQEVKSKLLDLLRLPQVDAPHAGVLRQQTTSFWKRDAVFGTVEKVSFPSEPGADIVAYWCVPHNAKPPYRTFICLQGHSTGMHNSIGVTRDDETVPLATPGDRDFAIGCMQRGIAALCVEQRAFGYRRELHLQGRMSGHTTCHDAMVGALMIGRTLNGERVWDVDRSIDWLEARGDIDLSTLGVMGNSGGGTTSMYAIAMLDRLKAAIISCAFARFADSIVAMHHCCCNAVPDIMNWLDMGDILAAAAPKPLVVVNGVIDEIFPIASARSHIESVRAAYAAAGAPDKIKFVEGPEGHRYYADIAWNAMLPMISSTR